MSFDKNFVEGYYFKGIYIPALVKDIILFGQDNIVAVVREYNLTADDFDAVVELPLFKKEMREVRALIDSSPNALIQLKARAIVEEGLTSLASIVMHGERDGDRVKAMELLSKIAGVLGAPGSGGETDNGKPVASGLVLNVNLGPGGLVPPMPDTRRPLRRVEQIQEVIDVK